MCFRNCPNGDSEKYALFKLINIITSSPKYNSNLRIAIITDYNLGGHIKYNKGELPLYKDFYLPTNFTVLYASSDKKDNVLNTFITMCDKDAKTLLRELDEKGYIPNSNPPIPSIEAIPDLSNR
jgi:hypothetical protein